MNAGRRRALYPLDAWLLPPVVWGGSQLQRSYGKAAPPDQKLGESWEVSCVAGRESRVAGTGETLAEAFAAEPAHFLGGSDRSGSFPLLVKLLATSAPLSVQVHPDDAQASRIDGSPAGKHEAWVVLEAAPGAEVCAGLAADATPESLIEAAAAGDAARVRSSLQSHAVMAGDVVEVPPGCVHAPGAGLVLYEVQQPVDLTYRIFDWNRPGVDGKPRPLHADKASQVLDPACRPVIRRSAGGASAGTRVPLARTRHFRIERWRVDGRRQERASELLLVTCVGGAGTLSAGADQVPLAPGGSCVVPASTAMVDLNGKALDIIVAGRP